MKPNDLYSRAPIKTSYDLYCLNDILEVDLFEVDSDQNEELKRVEIRYYQDYCFDGRRTWTLASVFFDNTPVLIFQRAGREGRDHQGHFITNRHAFNLMEAFFRSLLPPPPDGETFDPAEDVPTLDTFYGHSLDLDWDEIHLASMLQWASSVQRTKGVEWILRLAGIITRPSDWQFIGHTEKSLTISAGGEPIRLLASTTCLRALFDGRTKFNQTFPDLQATLEFIRLGVLG